jgi:uncharacterized protein (DUF58 family)
VPVQGTDFDHLRDYTTQDDIRSIDWKATARSSTPVARSYQSERHQTVLLALDAGRLLAARAGERAKFEWCLEAACSLAQAALSQGDQVGVLCYADRILAYVPARPGASHIQAILDNLYSIQPRRCESLHDRAIAYLRSQQRKRALIAIFTDLGDPTSAGRLLQSLLPLRPTHLPLILTIHDQEMDSLAHSLPADQTALYRVAVANQLLKERHQVLLELRRQGALTLDRPAQDLKLEAVQTYLDVKLRNRL